MAKLAPAVIVLERRPVWEGELKQRLSPERILVRPCRAAPDMLELAREMPGSVVIIDMTPDVPRGLKMLLDLSSTKVPAYPIAIVGSDDFQVELAARELGAIGVFSESAAGDAVAALCRRCLLTARPTAGGPSAL
ncbi:MAG: hypothetical protein ACT4QC_17020 [Planctomycetaceae bacterium]